MSELSTILTAEDKRPAVVADLAETVDNVVSNVSGFAGMTIKAAYASARKARPNVASEAVDRFLPNLADALDKYWKDYQDGQPEGGFGAYLSSRSDEVSRDLLAIADQKVKEIDNSGMNKMYNMFRSKADSYVKDALPQVGDVVEKHAK